MDPSPLTLVCFAVKEEGRFFDRLIDGREDFRILLTGVGRRNAERTVREALVQSRPKLVLSCGFAGGLNPALGTGTIVFEADSEPGLAASLKATGAHPARFHCHHRVAVTAEQKRALWNTTGADAVEMESQFIRAICTEQNLASATVRVILDAAEEDLPLDFNELMTPDQRLSPRKLALAIMRSPAKLGGLFRLQKQSEAAAQRLADVLVRVFVEGWPGQRPWTPEKPVIHRR
jgi:adenosylhomocysteine nucleosidase